MRVRWTVTMEAAHFSRPSWESREQFIRRNPVSRHIESKLFSIGDNSWVSYSRPFSCSFFDITRCLVEMGKMCELCGRTAALRCGADDAELCWVCDAEVHSANYLVARHLRSVLCSCCSAETDCQTSGTSPCPLSRRCSSCDPAHVSDGEKPHLAWSALSECNDDSEGLGRAVVPGLARGCAVRHSLVSQEGLSDALSSVEDEKAVRKSIVEGSRGRPKRLRGGGTGVGALAVRTKPSLSLRKHVTGRKSRKKRSGSPVSVIPVGDVFSSET